VVTFCVRVTTERVIERTQTAIPFLRSGGSRHWRNSPIIPYPERPRGPSPGPHPRTPGPGDAVPDLLDHACYIAIDKIASHNPANRTVYKAGKKTS
jgi:hypothetical protein